MTKRDLVLKISENTKLLQRDVAKILQMTLDELADKIVSGENIEFRDFGVFELKVNKQKTGRNPNQPEKPVIIPERVVVKFRSGKELKERVGKLKPKNLD